MNSIWMKIAGVAVVAIVVIIVAGRFTSDKPSSTSSTPAGSEPSEKNKTFADVAERDRQFAQAPKPAESQPVEPQPSVATPPAAPPAQPVPPAQPAPSAADGYVMPSNVAPGTKLYCKPLSEEDEIAAEQLLSWNATSRSIGRLPGMSYGPTVRACRDILTRWPDSKYAWRAKQILEDITNTSSRVGGFNITRQEMDVSRFLKPRPGTEEIPADAIRR